MYVCHSFLHVLTAPLRLYGSGSYSLSAVKEIVVTKSFLQMGNDIRKCQNKETYEDCTSKLYSSILRNECKCTSYATRNVSKPGQVYVLIL